MCIYTQMHPTEWDLGNSDIIVEGVYWLSKNVVEV